MANDKASTRVNGRNGEAMWVTEDELRFRTGGKEESMPVASASFVEVVDAEKARELVTTTDLIPHGAWTQKLVTSNARTAYLVVKGRVSCWVMEITKNQVQNALSFARGVLPKDEDEKGEGYIPGRVINTPLGGLFTIGSIACVFAASMLVFSYEQPLIGLLVAMAGLIMFFNIK